MPSTTAVHVRVIREAGNCPCGCGHRDADREGQLIDSRHSELLRQGLEPLPDFIPGVGHSIKFAADLARRGRTE